MRGAARFLLLAALFPAPTGSPAILAAEENRPPVVLRKQDPSPPVEAWGSGIAPAVTVSLRVDARGKVASVEIGKIEPATRLDAAFKKAVREALSAWRFAPAFKAGKPTEATLTWTIEFSKVGSVPLPASRPRWLTLASRSPDLSQSEEWHHFVSNLSWTERLEVLERTRRRAEGLLGASNRDTGTSSHFEVVTDVTSPGAAAKIARNLEAAYGATYKLFAGTIPPLPADDKVIVVAYAREASFDVFAAGSHLAGFAEGVYAPEGLLAFHAELEASEILTHLMLHEAAHAFLERHIVSPGVRLPLWLNEGLAEYIAQSDIEEGRIVPGGHKQKKTVYHNQAASRAGKSLSALGAEAIRKTLDSGKAISLDDLTSATYQAFYGGQYELHYGEAWLFVHFLRHGKPSWAAEEFPRFVLYVAEGFSQQDVFREVYGCQPSDFAEAFRKHVEEF